MAWYNDWDDFKSEAGEFAKAAFVPGYGVAKYLPDKLGLDEKRTDNEFKDIDRANFELQGADRRGPKLSLLAQQADLRGGPQAQDSSFRGDQVALVDRLRRQMNGEDSISALQLRQAADANVANQMSMAAGARPGNSAMAARLAMQNAGQINSGLAGQQALAGIAERNAAAGALGGVLQGARGQDLDLNRFNAQAQTQQTAMNDQRAQALRALELQNAALQQQGGIAYEQQRGNRFLGIAQEPTTGEKTLGMITGGLGAAAPIIASDERAKTGITPAGSKLDSLADRLRGYEYSYKEPVRHGEGRRLGVMAQDVERAAPELVVERGGVKHLDVNKSLGSALGLIGRLNERLNALEARG